MNILKWYVFKHRLLSFKTPRQDKHAQLLSLSEVADLYHFPYSRTTQIEDMVKSYSQELPAPLLQKQTQELDVILGNNTFGGVTTPIGLRLEERYRHIYILGATGTGKSTMLLHMITQDIQKGKGVLVVDPHGDLARMIASSIPQHRMKDVIYWYPRDIQYPFRLNLLELPEGLDENELAIQKEIIVEHIISIFRKVFSKDLSSSDTNAIRIERVFRNALYTALELENPTLKTVFNILVDKDFREQAMTKLTNEELKKFWENRYDKAGDMQQVKMGQGVDTRIERFLFSEIARRVLEKYTSTIDFSKAMDEGKIVICNLSKGGIGEDNMRLFGTMVLGEIQLAAQQRAQEEIEDRKDFYVYVDEFQNFATRSFVEMMAESRKFGVYLTIAEQSTSQQRDRTLVEITFSNVGTVVCFKNANTYDEQKLLPLFKNYLKEGEIMNLPAHRFYIKISAINPQTPFSGETILPELTSSKKILEEVIRLTREKYAPKYVKPEPEKLPSKKVSANRRSGEAQEFNKPDDYLT